MQGIRVVKGGMLLHVEQQAANQHTAHRLSRGQPCSDMHQMLTAAACGRTIQVIHKLCCNSTNCPHSLHCHAGYNSFTMGKVPIQQLSL